MNVIVFGMENCAGCVTVKTLLTQNGINFEYRDVMNPDNMGAAQEVGVRSVPTTVIYDQGYSLLDGVTYVGASQQVLKQIREAVGI